jgi:Cys-rich protein (TIGR01571 family)
MTYAQNPQIGPYPQRYAPTYAFPPKEDADDVSNHSFSPKYGAAPPPTNPSYARGMSPPQCIYAQPPPGYYDAVAPVSPATAPPLSPQAARDEGPSDWFEGLFGCANNVDICVEEALCPYCHLGFMYDFFESGTQAMDPFACCGALCIDFFFGVGVARLVTIVHLRGRLTRRYGIAEDDCTRGLTAICCSCCAMCQMHRELHVRGDSMGGLCYTPSPIPRAPPVSTSMSKDDELTTNASFSHQFGGSTSSEKIRTVDTRRPNQSLS